MPWPGDRPGAGAVHQVEQRRSEPRPRLANSRVSGQQRLLYRAGVLRHDQYNRQAYVLVDLMQVGVYASVVPVEHQRGPTPVENRRCLLYRRARAVQPNGVRRGYDKDLVSRP